MRKWGWGPSLAATQEVEETPGMREHGATMWRPRKRAAIYEPWREDAEESTPADTLVLNFQPPELWQHPFLSQLLSLWCFVMAALADQYDVLRGNLDEETRQKTKPQFGEWMF